LKLRDLHPKRFFFEAWTNLDAEEQDTASPRNPLLVAYIFSVVTVSLVLQEYLGGEETFLSIITFLSTPEFPVNHPILHSILSGTFSAFISEGGTLRSAIVLGGYYELFVLCYWALWRVLGFFILPALAVLVHPTLRKRPLGLSVKGMSNHLWVYAVLFVPVFIAVFVVSFFGEFQEYYPFYTNANRSLGEFIIWESFYVAQFFSLEFFFRGFMIQPLRREMGSSVIFAMMIPYVMIHIGKPMIECFAAIIAGIVLGTLALRTRSIWSGFLIHVSVALSMDLLSIWQKSRIGLG
jgi:membrane protease YdiL (CAAX protease family)